jgi:hypothetical protein
MALYGTTPDSVKLVQDSRDAAKRFFEDTEFHAAVETAVKFCESVPGYNEPRTIAVIAAHLALRVKETSCQA